MDLLMIVLPYASVIGGIIFAVSKLKKTLFDIKVQGSGSTQMLDEGKEKAKTLNKEPVQNPDVMPPQGGTGPQGYGMPPQGYGMGPMDSIGTPGVGGVTAVVGLVNGIGAIAQSGDVKNKFIAGRQITGPVTQSGQMVSNTKLKGLKSLNQAGSNIINTTSRGRVTMNQGRNAQAAISNGKGKVNINPMDDSRNYIYGNVRRLRSVNGKIYTDHIKIKGISKAQTLFAKNFSGPRGTMDKMLHLATGSHYGLNQPISQTGRLTGGPNVGVTLNDIKLTKVILGYHSAKGGRYVASTPREQLKMLEIRDFYGDKRNDNLMPSEKREVFILTQTHKNTRMLTAGTGMLAEERGSRYRNDLVKQVVEMAPHLTRNQKIQVINRAMEMRNSRRRDQLMTNQALAAERTNQKINEQEEGRKALDDLLRDTSSVAINFNNYVDDNFDNIHNLSQEEIEQIEEQARENIRKRDDLSLEEKEKEFERLKAEMQTDALASRLEEVEGIVKDEILDNPDGAKEILGDNGVELLKGKLAKIQEERDEMYQKMLKLQRKNRNSSWEEFKKRRDEEMKNDIQSAINELYPGGENTNSPSQNMIPFVSRQAQEGELGRRQLG